MSLLAFVQAEQADAPALKVGGRSRPRGGTVTEAPEAAHGA